MSFCNMGDNQTYTHKYHYLVISESEIRMLDIHAYILVRVIVWYFDKTHNYCKKNVDKVYRSYQPAIYNRKVLLFGGRYSFTNFLRL